MDWSSDGSPRERSVHLWQPTQELEIWRTEPDIEEPEGEQAMRHRLSEISTAPSVQGHADQVGPRFIDRETNTSVGDI